MPKDKLPNDGGEPIGMLPDGKMNQVARDAPPFEPKLVTPREEEVDDLEDLDEVEKALRS